MINVISHYNELGWLAYKISHEGSEVAVHPITNAGRQRLVGLVDRASPLPSDVVVAGYCTHYKGWGGGEWAEAIRRSPFYGRGIADVLGIKPITCGPVGAFWNGFTFSGFHLLREVIGFLPGDLGASVVAGTLIQALPNSRGLHEEFKPLMDVLVRKHYHGPIYLPNEDWHLEIGLYPERLAAISELKTTPWASIIMGEPVELRQSTAVALTLSIPPWPSDGHPQPQAWTFSPAALKHLWFIDAKEGQVGIGDGQLG